MDQPTPLLFRDRHEALATSGILLWTSLAWGASFWWMGQPSWPGAMFGLLLCLHAMVLAAYLVHEAAHTTLFAQLVHNRRAGEWVGFMAGAGYASFDRIRHMHLRHHRDRADLSCFDFKGLLQRHPMLKRLLQALEWAYIPASELVMHGQVICRPFLEPSQRQHRGRVLAMLLLRGTLLTALAAWSAQAFLLYLLAWVLLLHVLNFFDAFHHTFDQFFVAADQPVPPGARDRAYEQANTFSNVVSARWRWLNLLTLNFGYHNAHHERAAAPWYRLAQVHQELYGAQTTTLMPLSRLLRAWHRHRVARVSAEHYGAGGAGDARDAVIADIDQFVGAHGVSFLTVV